MNPKLLQEIKQSCEDIEKAGHGTVAIKIKNGAIYLIEATVSKLYEKPIDVCQKQ